MSTPYDYKALIDEPAPETPCKCGGGCRWTGTFAELAEIKDCSLTPGDASPAGRCPECESLAYVTVSATDECLARFRAALTAARAFVASERAVRVDSFTLGGRIETCDAVEAAVLAEADECLAVIDRALASG